MVYEWDFMTQSVAEVADSLPTQGAAELAAFMDAVIFDPWEFALLPGEAADKTKNLRSAAFGSFGIVTFLILDEDRLLLVAPGAVERLRTATRRIPAHHVAYEPRVHRGCPVERRRW